MSNMSSDTRIIRIEGSEKMPEFTHKQCPSPDTGNPGIEKMTMVVAMFKNKLQQFTQKQCLPLPAYRTANEGFHHAPKFRSSVLVDGAELPEYTSKNTFRRIREAEQDAAKLAYECILSNAQQSGFNPMLDKEDKSSKASLHEFAFKKFRETPKYETILGEAGGDLPVYISRVTVKDKTFTGVGARSMKLAEQLAARAALQSLPGPDNTVNPHQMMSPKRKDYGEPTKANSSEHNQKKIKSMVAEGPGDCSQVKRVLTASAPRSSNPAIKNPGPQAPWINSQAKRNIVKPAVRPPTPTPTPATRPVTGRRPGAQTVRYGLGNAVQGGYSVNRKMQQHSRYS